MDLLFITLGVIDLIAGGILFFQDPLIVRLIAALLVTKGILTILKNIFY